MNNSNVPARPVCTEHAILIPVRSDGDALRITRQVPAAEGDAPINRTRRNSIASPSEVKQMRHHITLRRPIDAMLYLARYREVTTIHRLHQNPKRPAGAVQQRALTRTR